MDLKFLEFMEEYPRVVLIALLALLSIGGIAGAMYVQSLKVALEVSERITESRIKLLEEQRQNDIRVLRASNSMLREQAEATASAMTQAEQSLEEIRKLLTTTKSSTKTAFQAAIAPIHSIEKNLLMIRDSVARSREVQKSLETLKISKGGTDASPALGGPYIASSGLPEFSSPEPSRTVAWVAVSSLLFALLLSALAVSRWGEMKLRNW